MATRAQLLAQPRSGVTAGAQRGGIGAGHGQAATSSSSPSSSTASSSSGPPSSPSSSTAPSASPPSSAPPSAGKGQAGPGAGGRATRSVSTVTEQGAGLLVALFAWPVGVNLLKGGPSQMWAWIKAKFINQVGAGAGQGAGGAPVSHGTTQKRGTHTAGGRG